MKKNEQAMCERTAATVGTENPRSTTVGLDLGDRWSRYCILNRMGEVLEEERVRTTAAGLEADFASMPAARIVIEVGGHSPWVSRQLRGYGHEVVVANARKVRLIYETDRKNDRLDARMLARLGRVDASLLAPVQHRSAEAQADLAVVRSRDALVAARTQLVNASRGMVKAIGGRLPKSTTGAFARKTSAAIPAALRVALAPVGRKCAAVGHFEIRQRLPATVAGAVRAVHPGTICAGLGSATVGSAVGNEGREKWQEARRDSHGAEVGRAVASALGYVGGLRASAWTGRG